MIDDGSPLLKRRILRLMRFMVLCYTPFLCGQESAATSEKFDYNINMLICYGQSLSVGGGATNAQSDFKNILSFKGGCNEWGSKVDINNPKSVADFYGDDFVLLDSLASKNWPPVAAIAVSWMHLLEQEDAFDVTESDHQFVLSTPGYSGVPIEKLSKDTDLYRRLLLSVQKGYEFSKKRNKTFGVPSLFWVQGESNFKTDTEEQYYQKLKQIFIDLNADIKSITKQEKDVVFLSYQTAPIIGTIPYPSAENPSVYEDSGPSFAQLRLAKENNNVYMGGAMYQYEYGDLWHPKDRAIVGIQLGIMAKRILSDKVSPGVFSPISHQIETSGSDWLLSVKFEVPVAPMKFDVSGDTYHNSNGKQKNYGFALKNAKGENIISEEPDVINGNTVRIRCSENPKNANLSYALNGHFGGGNLCDSQNITIDNKGMAYVIDNFCPAFRGYLIE